MEYFCEWTVVEINQAKQEEPNAKQEEHVAKQEESIVRPFYF